jgi:hypothetical protein
MPDSILNFHNLHKGETALLVGNGENLKLTPPDRFEFPSFGMNTIHLYEGWKPTYYTAVDSRVMREFGKAITEKYADVPKFIPRPNLDAWQGENFYRFYHRPGPLVTVTGAAMNYEKIMSEDGISYGNIMHVALQLAAWMGFTTILMIGVHHKPLYAQSHFWGCDHGMSATPPVEQWLVGYAELVKHMQAHGIRVLNISPETFVPDYVIPREDWRSYESKNA